MLPEDDADLTINNLVSLKHRFPFLGKLTGQLAHCSTLALHTLLKVNLDQHE
jgi:hypothetical protein